ncbi:unnamed protein product [Spirodela intermedia]|uniref:Uncharacterized protein n=1 Tax=Spirodela intermedia TaxID=51605 RepID=A0A7I8J8N4_SPIIN|nr:unnamed protein product [Spirodela intermedia]CAA6665802.1 unnamed protein product [Spirodela intermedia]
MQRLCVGVRRCCLRRPPPQSLSKSLPHPSPTPAPSDCRRARSFFSLQTQKTGECLPGEFLRRASLGFCRGSRFATGFTPLKPKPLDSIIDIERAKACSPEDLVSVWDDYHLGRGHIGASMKAKLFHLLEQRAISCRYFVLPLWRGSGYTNMFIQDAARPHHRPGRLQGEGTQASPYLTVTYYKDFAESKDVVLVRGDVVFTSKLSDPEAKWLIETAQSFYLNDGRYKLVERFNKETHEFEFADVLRALDMPSG